MLAALLRRGVLPQRVVLQDRVVVDAPAPAVSCGHVAASVDPRQQAAVDEEGDRDVRLEVRDARGGAQPITRRSGSFLSCGCPTGRQGREYKNLCLNIGDQMVHLDPRRSQTHVQQAGDTPRESEHQDSAATSRGISPSSIA